MAGTFHSDTVQGAQLELDSFQTRKIRTGWVDGIDISGDPDPIVLEKCLAASGFPALTSLHPNYATDTDMRLQRVRLAPEGTNIVRVFMNYETPQTGGTPTTYILTDDAFTTQVERNTIPGSRIPIRCGYVGQITTYNPDGTVKGTPEPASVPADFVSMRFFQPARVVSVAGLSYGKPPENKRKYVGYLNSDVWLGFQKGYWMLQRYRTSVSKYSGYYTFEAIAATRSYEDWSETGILRNSETGKYVEVTDAVVTAMNALPYTHGMIYPTNVATTVNGLVRVGGNPVTSFAALFGFSVEEGS